MHTVETVQAELVYQRPGRADKCLSTRLTPRHEGEVLASLAASTDGENDFHLGVLRFQLREGPDTALRAVHGHLRIGPFIA